ncbi:STAS domain-containing protein [Streptomyces sp. Tu6071]|uniref:STAS domain-containing protein n=1 Tax=Streptomyces sp. Tu6071 TaxID=355249 RepID=UPI0002E9CE9D|nr:STAS domain-containing protein [Streptomyces sp. Tu6071]
MNDPLAGTEPAPAEPAPEVPDPVGTRPEPVLPAAEGPPATTRPAEAPPAEGPVRLRVALSERPERVLVEIDGVLDYETEGRLRGALDGVAAKPGRRFVLDLSRVGFLDSGGIGALLAIRRGLLSRGAELAVTEVSPMVARLLRMTGLDEVLLPGTGC